MSEHRHRDECRNAVRARHLVTVLEHGIDVQLASLLHGVGDSSLGRRRPSARGARYFRSRWAGVDPEVRLVQLPPDTCLVCGCHPMSRFTLRPYQTACLDAIASAQQEGVRRQLAVLSTGLGRTVLFSHLRSHLELPGRFLVLAHREELLDQACRKIIASNPSVRVGIEQGDRRATSIYEYVRPDTLELAEYIFVLTTVPRDILDVPSVLNLYRTR